MAFPTGWSGPFELSINSAKIPGSVDIANHPWLIQTGDLPDAIFNNSLSDGGDIRFTTDQAGTTEIPVEIVLWDTSAKTCEIWVKATAQYAADTPLYCWWGNSGASMPAASDTYGSQNVWRSEYSFVFHFGETPDGTSGDINDSTSNGNHGTSQGTMTSDDVIAGQFGKALEFDGTDDAITVPDGTATELGTGTIQIIVKTLATAGNGSWLSKGNRPTDAQLSFDLGIEGAALKWNVAKNNTDKINQTGGSYSSSEFRLYHATIDLTNGTSTLYQNGVQVAQSTNANVDAILNSTENFLIGLQRTYGDFFADIIVDEVRMNQGDVLPQETCEAEYNNMFGTDFWIQGDNYTRSNEATLPSGNTDLTTLYSQDDVDDVDSDDGARVSLLGDAYLVHQFKIKNTNNTDSIGCTVNLQSDLAPSTSTVYLQFYNHDTSTWDTVDSDNSSSADTDFDLIANITSGMADYYDGDFEVTARVYQQST